MARVVQSGYGEMGMLTAGIGALLRIVPIDTGWIGYAFIAFGTVLGAIYVSKKSKFDVLFRNLRLGIDDLVYPIYKKKTRKDGYDLYEFTIPAGMCLDDFIKVQPAIEIYLGAKVDISIGFKNLLIKVYEAEKVTYDYEPVKVRGALEIVIGYDRSGKIVTADLSSGEPHMYCAGETGSGKSTWLRSALVNLILHNDVDLYLGDLKNGVEFNLFRRCSKIKCFAKSEAEIKTMLHQVRDEVNRRYKLFSDSDVEDIKQYNRSNKKLRYQLVVIDEFADLMNEKESIELLEGLAAKARACGIHLLLATQRPDAKVLSGRIKANISNILGLKTLDKVNSGIIIGHNGLEELRGKGHGLFKRGVDETYIQAPLLTTERAKQLIAPFNVEKSTAPAPKLSGFDFLDTI